MTYKRCLLLVVLSFISISFEQTANAVSVEGLSQTQILVSSQSFSERRNALRQALAIVIVKNTGSKETLTNPTIKAALVKPTSYLRQYSYLNEDDKLKLMVNFDESKLIELLRNAKVPIWERNRPISLLWLSFDSTANQQILSDSSTEPLVIKLKKIAEQKALPIILPVLDLSELSMISESDIKGYFIDAFPKVSEKYNVDYLVLANITQNDAGYQYHLQLYPAVQDGVRRPILIKQSSIYQDPQEFVEDLVSQLAEYYSNEYSISVVDQQQAVSIEFTQVISLKQSIELQRYLSQLAIIKSVKVNKLQGEKLVLSLSLYGSTQDLDRVLKQDPNIRLKSNQDFLGDESESKTYLWMGN
ncbi:DUF2066 domain-containing protein [Parashewanella tropica]|uniref:DUF2066 domain-containing protein n=1 Tax=Parashewanella tropica TaxID=2547970 RepID=UPI00105AA605|nr:DUF2066 domain-containing protein [Parashewanella tropica]